MVTYTDKVVGKIVDKLEELGLRENTLIIFTGDNGTYAGMETDFNGGTYVGGKGNTKDNGTHVPLIVNWPGNTPEGKVSQSLVDFSDMLPTIADVAGIEVPRRWGVDGISFASEIQGSEASPRNWIYCWYSRDGIRDKAKELVRNQRFKVYGDGRIFNVVDDFNEENPLKRSDLEGSDKATVEMLNSVLKKLLAITAEADPIQNAKRDNLTRGSKESSKKANQSEAP